MTDTLIINARGSLSWHQRLWSDASTILIWGVWLKLWFPVVRTFTWATDSNVFHRLTALGHLSSGSAVSFPHYAMALVGTSGTLILWNRLPALQVSTPDEHSVSDYARHFQLPEAEILAGRSANVCVVHHDDGGRIVRVELQPV
ncbi:MAG: poly-beta-1,6-N-acetyl-D-glucosamine biosynthesis protein PgaD [Anaeromyxobacteraceae bacterium]